ncbi:Phosphatidylinositol 4,5-bisphosphate 3-kinase catalytic subunit alpha isoform [Cichlidogyrus casuarinus]|uniref:Phosphatidylinositol 4,5-bisphosphate 3-kinase catalytic subunit alpha isoform n=1 Tax=Cichlidogyrus casuarinus TaxID=1844966 RepID=A0ABD2QL17_9PLAT
MYLESFNNPLEFCHFFEQLKLDKCSIKKSKMKPFWMVWSNGDSLSRYHFMTHQIIFKHGDDLRQDMLTLQLLKLMDTIWKDEGEDYCLSPYSCLATGSRTGLIEVVRGAQTIMSIQNESRRAVMQLDPLQLHRWLEKATLGSREMYERAINNFTRSCAGYCVATFVLGIRDRHNDNIMADETGRLFHIDFGHILNNKKKKFGINRERVPFVLPVDFVFVITRGKQIESAQEEYKKFVDLCVSAYLSLRRHSRLILTLLSIMLVADLPELQNLRDLDYVRHSLAVDKDEKSAESFFRNVLNQAYSGGWSTKLDWYFHWMNS